MLHTAMLLFPHHKDRTCQCHGSMLRVGELLHCSTHMRMHLWMPMLLSHMVEHPQAAETASNNST